MATYNGTLVEGVVGQDSYILSQNFIDAWDDGVAQLDAIAISDIVGNIKSSGSPSVIGIIFGGTLVAGFRNDYYYRIHAEPNEFNYGAILSAQQDTFIVWNAWFVEKTCTAINKTFADEFVLTGLTTPFILNGLAYTEYTIDVPKEGASVFESAITFDFLTELPVVTISGVRLILFPYIPNIPITERLEWVTDILTGRSGAEQRMSIRQTPRQSFSFNILLQTEQDQARFEAMLFTWQKRAWGIPVWPEQIEHTDTITATDTVITVDTTKGDFRDGGLGVIWKSVSELEVIQIETVAVGSLTLSTGVANTYTGSKAIAPVRIAQMNTQVKYKYTPDGYSVATVNFIVKDNIGITGYTAVVEYDSLTVLEKAAYVELGGVSGTSQGDIVITDFETGDFNLFSDSDFNLVSQSHRFKNWDRSECWVFRQFLHYLYGMQNIVWIPSWKNDLLLTQTMGAADVNFNISNIGLADNMGLNVLRTHLAFVFPSGTILYREIMGITESGSEEIITIDSALGIEVEPGDCEISFLDKYRLASDAVEINWAEPNRNTCNLNFLRVRG